jgi:hypothetical protein
MEQNQLVKMPFADMLQIGKVFAESGMFADAKAAAQAIVKIQAGQEIGIPPFAAMSGIHIIQGKPTMGAGLIASIVKGSGKYDYIVNKLDDKICDIDFFQGDKKIGNSTFTIADATKAGTKNLDKFPKNMLFARAISNGVKWYCPDVFAGPVYVPEEMEPVKTEDIQHEEVKAPVQLPATKSKVAKDAFDKAIARLQAGEIFLYQKLKDTYDLSNQQLVALKPFQVKAEELASAIQNLDKPGTDVELEDYKKQLPAYVVSDASFVTASNTRYDVIMAAQA